MKKIYFLFLLVVFQVNSQIVNIPDANFKAKLLSANSNPVAIGTNGNWITIDTNSNNQIEVSEALNVEYLSVYISNIQDLTGIQSFANLKSLRCYGNQLTTLNLTGLSNLNYLDCSNNQMANLSISGLSNLTELHCGNNLLNTFIFSGLTGLEKIVLENNQITSLNLTPYPNLKYVNCNHNLISNFNVSGMNNLQFLYCEYNAMTAISLSNLPNVIEFSCSYNNLTSLDVTSLPLLREFYCIYNQLTSLNISGLHKLRSIYCNNNQLTSLNIDAYDDVSYVRCSYNNLTSLTVNGLSNYGSSIDCDSNQLTTIDVSGIKYLTSLSCNYNMLQSLFLKNGLNINLYIYDNPNIQYICADESQFSYYQNILNYYGVTNCNINSYCSFVPGGIFYTVQGNSKLDIDSNGCSSNDSSFSNVKFNISNGTTTNAILSNTSGNYSIPLQQGTYSVTPIIENPSYFTISPASFQVNFPAQTSPFNQNFCITPNGVHNDLEVVIIPLLPARPGFDATYKILYKNKGNTTLSGSVVLDFEDNKMDFVSSTPSYTTISTGELIYNYFDLAPFEIREIIITMNINSPTETPAVNIGDKLSFIVNINPLSGDAYILDNRINFKQTVVGSYDPNDKTCIEGDVVGAEVIGNYIHYVIRFENTGTFPAENIVVKDIIDATKFNINTLTPTCSSHPFVTKISNGTIVEFIFENIQLPFDDANNDGYVAFKIKTLPSLSIGDTFSNNANIYFDYNFPIETNTTLTTIQNLNKTDFEFTDYVTLYPNPANSKLNFKIKKDIDVSSINIYNSLGQLVLVVTNPHEFIDVSVLKTGNYFVKIISNLGFSNCQFLKE
ncbi:T9SS type A sorting domain-containing protein [Flavobacterium sp.]|uniref:DUF7619 domain-containing protein n=1 Tax=Flavobacterium sp. TaxID=239 RepID=UPI0026145A8F|nr:T9SS type A sorting domain-containing protein [Flavobacterium sp.]